jgi:hypothetical protein
VVLEFQDRLAIKLFSEQLLQSCLELLLQHQKVQLQLDQATE